TSSISPAPPPRSSALRHDDAVRGFHLFHHEVGVRLLHTAHRGDAIAEEAAVTLHVRYAYLEQVIEPARHHVALHHLIVRQHHLLEALEGVGRGAIQQHLHVGEQAEPEPAGAQARKVPLDVPGGLQAPHALERRRDGEVHLTVTPTLERVRRLESAGYIERSEEH